MIIVMLCPYKNLISTTSPPIMDLHRYSSTNLDFKDFKICFRSIYVVKDNNGLILLIIITNIRCMYKTVRII